MNAVNPLSRAIIFEKKAKHMAIFLKVLCNWWRAEVRFTTLGGGRAPTFQKLAGWNFDWLGTHPPRGRGGGRARPGERMAEIFQQSEKLPYFITKHIAADKTM